MGVDIKRYFVEELKQVYQQRIAAAARAEAEARVEADPALANSRRREDAKEAGLQGRLSKGHRRRRLQAVSEMERLLAFAEGGLPKFGPGDRVDLGLADAAVASRFLCWGVSLSAVVFIWINMAAQQVMSDSETVRSVGLVITAGLGFLVACSLWFAFFPRRSKAVASDGASDAAKGYAP